ncbi:MAG: OB-fold domain-containing protein [Pseudomonadales bacterium]
MAVLPVVDMHACMPLLPRQTLATRWHFQALAHNRLVTRYCGHCERHQFPPLDWCPGCGARDSRWRELAGTGTLYASTRMHAVAEAFRPFAPVTVGVVDLVEGVRVLAWLLSPELVPDAPVQLVSLRFDDGNLLGARLLEETT